MTSDTSKLFADICKRGCIIETSTKYEYATKDLPKCLILINENFPFEHEFMIKSIIPNINRAIFGIDCRGDYTYKIGILWFRFIYIYMIDTRDLDFLIPYYVHYNNDKYVSQYHNRIYCVQSLENINNYKQILKNKMIENLTELYLIKFMYLTENMLSLPEIKIVIIEFLFKLDKWDKLEI